MLVPDTPLCPTASSFPIVGLVPDTHISQLDKLVEIEPVGVWRTAAFSGTGGKD